MKLMMWTLCLTWSLFYAADALECVTCTNLIDPQCTNTTSMNCPADMTRCLSATLSLTADIGQTAVAKLCVPAATCASLGSEAFSASLGFGRGAASTLCCETDGCNSETLSVPTQMESNDLTCFTCDSLTDEFCNKTVQCVGIEDRCVNGSVRSTPDNINMFGCASASLCSAIDQLVAIPQFNPQFIEGPSCCEGDLCNSARPTVPEVDPSASSLTTLTVPEVDPSASSHASILSLSILPLLMAPLTFTLNY